MNNRRQFIKRFSQGAVALALGNQASVLAGTTSEPTREANLSVRKVHVVFKTHLDVGFTSSARKITRNLWEWKIPTEIATARELEAEGIRPSFVYGSWVIWETLRRQKGGKRADIERAIGDGILQWSAVPHTFQAEFYDPSLLDELLSVSQQLDQQFGIKTSAAKLTDVPGQTIALLPHFARAGVEFLHIGVNWASKNPDVPPVFRWRHADGSEVITMYCPGGYGSPQGVEGHSDWLGLITKGDNMDPWTAVEVRDAFEQLRKRFPNAEVSGSSMNAYAHSLKSIKDQLPVITDEIGDTWVYGCGSDPQKVAAFRELSRLRKEWIEEKSLSSEALRPFSIYLGMVGEHTWGFDHGTYLDDDEHLSKASFTAYRNRSNYRLMEESWKEQREYIDQAVETLPEGFAVQAKKRLETLIPRRPDLSQWQVCDAAEEVFTPLFKVRLSSNGAVGSLIGQGKKARVWFDAGHPLGLLRYQVFSDRDLARYNRAYWAGDMGESFLPDDYEQNSVHSLFCEPRLETLYRRDANDFTALLARLHFPAEVVETYGAPAELWMEYRFLHSEPVIEMKTCWFGKDAIRVREASWFSVVPLQKKSDDGWRMEKIDSFVSPCQVVSFGGRNLHAVWEKIEHRKEGISFETLDAPLFSPGRPAVYDFHNEVPDMQGGIHINLHNNLWGTNYPAWYDDDALFRFRLTLG